MARDWEREVKMKKKFSRNENLAGLCWIPHMPIREGGCTFGLVVQGNQSTMLEMVESSTLGLGKFKPEHAWLKYNLSLLPLTKLQISLLEVHVSLTVFLRCVQNDIDHWQIWIWAVGPGARPLLPNLGSAESILERKQVSLPPESVFRGALSSAFTYLLSLKHYSCCSIVLHESYLKGTKFQYIHVAANM